MPQHQFSHGFLPFNQFCRQVLAVVGQVQCTTAPHTLGAVCTSKHPVVPAARDPAQSTGYQRAGPHDVSRQEAGAAAEPRGRSAPRAEGPRGGRAAHGAGLQGQNRAVRSPRGLQVWSSSDCGGALPLPVLVMPHAVGPTMSTHCGFVYRALRMIRLRCLPRARIEPTEVPARACTAHVRTCQRLCCRLASQPRALHGSLLVPNLSPDARRLGTIETRPSFHDDTHIWPVGYRVRRLTQWQTTLSRSISSPGLPPSVSCFQEISNLQSDPSRVHVLCHLCMC